LEHLAQSQQKTEVPVQHFSVQGVGNKKMAGVTHRVMNLQVLPIGTVQPIN
jgi:hypothetical protein